jgi:hypothetical protein
MQVGFQPFGEIPHYFLRKEVGRSPLETDMNFPSVSAFSVVIYQFFNCRFRLNFRGS